MAAKSKIGISGQKLFTPGKPKTTSIGQGKNSRPLRRGKKAWRGQGK